MLAGTPRYVCATGHGFDHAANPRDNSTMSEVSDKIIYSMVRVSKHYNRTMVIEDISLSFLCGAKIGVLGLSGSGKSTLLSALKPRKPPSQAPDWPTGAPYQPQRASELLYTRIQNLLVHPSCGCKHQARACSGASSPPAPENDGPHADNGEHEEGVVYAITCPPPGNLQVEERSRKQHAT